MDCVCPVNGLDMRNAHSKLTCAVPVQAVCMRNVSCAYLVRVTKRCILEVPFLPSVFR